LGTTFGGDGRTTFALPDLRGRVPVHPGTGAGLTSRRVGQKGGTDTETLNVTEIPSHTHAMQATNDPAGEATPDGNLLAFAEDNTYLKAASPTLVTMKGEMVANNGGGQSHTNMQPYLGVHFIIATRGLYPSRN
ncbi:MAG: phage tail protein, partial [Rhodothermales bacterium]